MKCADVVVKEMLVLLSVETKRGPFQRRSLVRTSPFHFRFGCQQTTMGDESSLELGTVVVDCEGGWIAVRVAAIGKMLGEKLLDCGIQCFRIPYFEYRTLRGEDKTESTFSSRLTTYPNLRPM